MTTYATYRNMEPYNTTKLTYDGALVAVTSPGPRKRKWVKITSPTTMKKGR